MKCSEQEEKLIFFNNKYKEEKNKRNYLENELKFKLVNENEDIPTTKRKKSNFYQTMKFSRGSDDTSNHL